MQFSIYQESRIGGRKVNQDRMGYSYTRDALLLLLADGLGGHAHGEIAAQLAMRTLAQRFQQQARPSVARPAAFLADGLMAAHHEIHRHRLAHGWPEAPRTTIVACLIQHGAALWAHCGDSRLYWLRAGQILARTRDHSQVERLIARGLVAPSARASHPDRNKLFNCLGAGTAPRIELSRRASLLPGDVVLLCSDGLWSMLPDEELAACLRRHTVVRAVPELIGAALGAAGPRGDNVTALAIMWQGNPVQDGLDSVALEPPNTISTEALAGDQPGPTVEGAADPFDAAEIDRAIAEIRGAIEKSSHLLKPDRNDQA